MDLMKKRLRASIYVISVLEGASVCIIRFGAPGSLYFSLRCSDIYQTMFVSGDYFNIIVASVFKPLFLDLG